MPFSLGFVLSILLAVAMAIPIGMLVLGLHDIYLAIATLGFGEIVRIIALNGDKLVHLFSENKELLIFNGAEGITLTYTTPKVVAGLPDTTWDM